MSPRRKSACWSAPGCRSGDEARKHAIMKMWAIMRRDLLKLSRNPLTLLSTILMPIVYLVIIGNSFNGNLKHLSLAIVTEDHGDYGRRMVEKLQALEAGPKTVTLS